MATYTWEFGSENEGLHFKIDFDAGTNLFTVTSLVGSFDLNALWWSDGDVTVDGDTSLSKEDKSLNMNGSNTVWEYDEDGNPIEGSDKIVWDDYQYLSNPGLGELGEDKGTFISEGESLEFAADQDFIAFLLGLDEGVNLILGVRATSVGGEGGDGIKWVDKEPKVSEDEPENQAPTDIRINIDPVFAAAVGGVSQGQPSSDGNNTSGEADEGGMLIGILSASDPDEVDTHVFQIVDDNGDALDHDLFEIVNGNELRLKEGESISTEDAGIFNLTIKVTDDGEPPLSYYETFTFNVGTTSDENLEGTNHDGDGTLADPVVGDDLIFGFGNGDTLNYDGVALTGTSGDDALFGGQGQDTLHGGEGDDQLFGGWGNDHLYGGPGADIMSGGEGNDTFFWLAGDMAGTTNDHFDVITDWSTGNNNKLDLTGLLADFGFESGNDTLADWVQVSINGADTVVAVATSEADVDGENYTNLVTLLGVTFDEIGGQLNIVA